MTSDTTLCKTGLSFELHTSGATKSSARAGKLTFANSKHEINTPAVLPNTHRGFIPHLTNDHALSLPSELLHLSLEQFADLSLVSYEKCPFDLRRYLGLPKLEEGGPLLIMGLRDPSRKHTETSPSYEQQTDIKASRGSAKMDLSYYLKINASHPPDLLVAMCDEPEVASPSKKRLENSLARSLHWLKFTLDAAKVGVFAPLMGSSNPIARTSYAEQLMEENDKGEWLDQRIAGYILHMTPFISLPQAKLSQLFLDSLASLPANKPRLSTSFRSPSQIIRLIRDVGIDLFVDDWSYEMASIGVALDFDFPPAADVPPNQPLGINLFHSDYAISLAPLASSALPQNPHEKHPTRAYLHHLLRHHEITAQVLLSLHNTRLMKRFMTKIRQTIVDGTFEREAEAFLNVYEEDCSAAVEARGMFAEVEKQRKRGWMDRQRNKSGGGGAEAGGE